MGTSDYFKTVADIVKGLENVNVVEHGTDKKTLERSISLNIAGEKRKITYSCPKYLEWLIISPNNYSRGRFKFETFQEFFKEIKKAVSSQYKLVENGNRTMFDWGFQVPEFEYYENLETHVRPKISGNPVLTFDPIATFEAKMNDLPLDIPLPKRLEVAEYFFHANLILLPDPSILSLLKKEELPGAPLCILYKELKEPLKTRISKGYMSWKSKR